MVYPPNPSGGADSSSRPDDERHTLRIIAVGSITVVNYYVMQMFQLDYAEPDEWSKPLPTVNPNEVMRILTKRIRGVNT
ncbi:MAG TPA: hypothetical protein ACFE0H_02265 [Elainellaceae cyanobacterium]